MNNKQKKTIRNGISKTIKGELKRLKVHLSRGQLKTILDKLDMSLSYNVHVTSCPFGLEQQMMLGSYQRAFTRSTSVARMETEGEVILGDMQLGVASYCDILLEDCSTTSILDNFIDRIETVETEPVYDIESAFAWVTHERVFGDVGVAFVTEERLKKPKHDLWVYVPDTYTKKESYIKALISNMKKMEERMTVMWFGNL